MAENWFTKPGFREHFVDFSQEKLCKTQSSLNFLQSGPRKFTRSDFSGLAPIRRVLISGPISRDTAILSLRYPISRDTFSGWSALPQSGATPPPLVLTSTRTDPILQYRARIVRYLRWIQEGFKGGFLLKHLSPIRGTFLGDSVRILGVCPAVTLTFVRSGKTDPVQFKGAFI